MDGGLTGYCLWVGKRVRYDLVNKQQQHKSIIILKQKAEKISYFHLHFHLERKKKKLKSPNPQILSLQNFLKEIH